MNLQHATLTAYYFFSAASTSGYLSWRDQTIERLGIQPQHQQANVWRNQIGTRLLDIEQTVEFILIRVSLKEEDGPITLWRRLLQPLYAAHESLLTTPQSAHFLGCSLIYWGTVKEGNAIAVEKWQPHIPVEEGLPSPRLARFPFSQLWQLQKSQPAHRPESIYGLLTTQELETAVERYLIYHPSFWQAEAIRHRVNSRLGTWHEATQQANPITKLQQHLQQLLATNSRSIPYQQLAQLGICYADFQTEFTALIALHRQIINDQQRYQTLMDSLLTAGESSSLKTAVLADWHQALTRIHLEEQAMAQLNNQVTCTLSYHQLLLSAQQFAAAK